jgi:transposase
MHGPQVSSRSSASASASAEHSTHFTRVLAIDLGKFNSVLCDYESLAHRLSFESVQTVPQAMHDLLLRRVRSDADRSSTLVVFETCDCSGWVYDIAVALGLAVAVANPADEAWKWKRVKRKTDRDDALKMARMAARGELPTVHMPDPPQRQRRRLIQHRRSVVQRRTMSKNGIRSIYSQQGLQLPRGNKCWTKIGVKQIAEEARPIGECQDVLELWRGRLHAELQLLEALDTQLRAIDKMLDALGEQDERVKRLQTVPGVGPRLAEAVVAHIDDPHRFKNGRQVSAYAGLVPKQFESGTMKRVGKITRRGPSLLRGMLVEVAWVVYRQNEWAKRFVDNVSRGIQSRRRIAIVALARKLLSILWAMLRDGTEWRDPDQSKKDRCAGGGACSPPEDTGAVNVAVSSVAF